FLAASPGWKKSAALSLFVALGTACRLPAAPFFGLLWLASMWEDDSPLVRRAAVSTIALLAAFAVVFLPFHLAAPDAFRFWTIDFHRVSVPNKTWSLPWNVLVSFAPAVWLLVIASVSLSAARTGGWR